MEKDKITDQSDHPRKEDVTGRDRLAINLASRYIGQIVVIVSGFIIPRLIDDGLGPVALGIWDFGWSTVSYFRYIGFGFAAGLNRFVALYNARENYDKLQKAVSSTAYLQILLAALTVLVALGVSTLMPRIFDDIAPDQLEQSKTVVFLLGCTLAVKMLFWPSRGILTGYHRVTVTAGVTAVGDIVILVGMFTVLTTGGNLIGLGTVVLFSMIATEMTRMFMAKRIYPYRVYNWSVVSTRMLRKMVVFGVKNSVAGMPGLIVIQTIALCLAASAGPAALAYYARPMALFSHVGTLIKHYAQLLTPVAGSLQGLRQDEELKKFLLDSLQASFLLTLPGVLLVAGYGDVIVRVWMGDDYVIPMLAPLLGAAVLLPFGHSVAMRILIGVDSHGKVAVRALAYTAVTLAIACTVAFSVGWTPIVAAMVLGVSMLVGPGIVVLVEACKRFHVSFGEYLSGALLKPMLCNTFLLGVILISRALNDSLTLPEAMLWGAFGGIGVVVLYWKFLLSDKQRSRLMRKIGIRKPAKSPL